MADAQSSVPADNESASQPNNSVSAPSISVPKGGGAIRGIGEKFAANPVTGTGSMTVPIATSPGRSGFGPQLALAYDSGSGNGPFGFGWTLSLPSITRKTDKGLPQYFDAVDCDVFILTGAEDLVPEFEKDCAGDWVMQDGEHVVHDTRRTVAGVVYAVRRYRPRVEGLFARIERWTSLSDATDVFWRSISKDNITTWYGKSSESRIADPADPARIFRWLICESHDDKGNVLTYGYKAEDSVGVDLGQAHERNRDDQTRSAQRYLKRVRYGNRTPYFPELKEDAAWPLPAGASDADGSQNWCFEVVLDYDDHDLNRPTPSDDRECDDAGVPRRSWAVRQDPFSSYRSAFEVRTYRLCQRVLMFHHFPGEAGVGNDCLVRSTDLNYSFEQDPTDARNPIYSFLLSVQQTGYRRAAGGGYLSKSLPRVEFEYTEPVVQDAVEEVDPASLANLPMGVDGAAYQWTDLHGEGIPGILAEQADAWFYKRNFSPIGNDRVELGPLQRVATKPNLTLASGAQFMDLAGDGQPDVVVLNGPTPGLYEHDEAEGWQPFRPFARLNRDLRDPNVKFVDLSGDGHADVLITEDDALVWHASQAEAGFGAARRVAQALDEEHGPRLVFSDGTQSVYLADMSGDNLNDLVRIRKSGEVCYWPNLGYGRFGAKVTMDHAPQFDHPDQFDHKRIRLADIDGSGTTDIIYLHRDGVRLYFNQSGNSWSAPQKLNVFPRVDDIVSIAPTDLLGNGTACLVWSSPLPGDTQRPMRYVNLMGGQKPHLLVKTVNNLGAETRVRFAPSTKFYLQDRRDGKPWLTRLPFPVHVVEQVETYDHISHNRFVTRYAYHHGYFDGEEREFRGFGMVEQFDTEEYAALAASGTLAHVGGDGWGEATNIEAASHVPPIHTKTWFHTGVHLGRNHVSNYYAGLLDATDHGEYYREPGLNDAAARELLLDDTVLPPGLTVDEERQACRALKGSMLRQEVYALDGTDREEHPYSVSEQSFSVRLEQPQRDHRHAVFFTHPRESISYHYERNPADPRIAHAMTLEVDAFGNVLKSAAIGYGRRQSDRSLTAYDQAKQCQTLVTYTENDVTNAIDEGDAYRTPLACEARTYELTGYSPTGLAGRFQFSDFVQPTPCGANHVFDSELNYEDNAMASRQRRLIEQVRTRFRPNDFGVSRNDPLALLPLGQLESLAMAGESYKLAFTAGLLAQVYRRPLNLSGAPPPENLLPDPAAVLAVDTDAGRAADRGGYVDLDADGHWWIPSGRVFYSPNTVDTAAEENAHAHQHFFLSKRFRDPFHAALASTESLVTFDDYDLLALETCDALGNRVTAGERDTDGNLTVPGNDYRVLQAGLMMDANRNRAAVAFDVLGMVVGTAVMGKPEETLGDSLDGFTADLADSIVLQHAAEPLADPHSILGRASSRLVYDLDAYQRTKADAEPQPAVVYSLTRETHDADLSPGQQTKVQHSFSYSDGFGRELQKKIQAESGPVPRRDAEGAIVTGVDGQPDMTHDAISPRWVGSGWTVFNNKGKPVRQYEPFFTDTHHFEFDVRIGVSPVLFYDPAERVIATLHPNDTFEKVVFDPWQQTTYDVNDTCAPRNDQTGDPRTDPDIQGYVAGYFSALPANGPAWQTWHVQRIGGALGPHEQAAAAGAAAHADTPTTVHFDALGRPCLTVARNRVACAGHDLDGAEQSYFTRVELDIEGNQRVMRDAIEQAGDPLGRVVMRYDYDMLGNRIHQLSMEAGARWMLNDAAGKPIRVWDSRSHSARTEYDPLRRPIRSFVSGADAAKPKQELLTDRLVYGEQHPENEQRNLRGKLYLQLDQAGAVTSERLDFKGNSLSASRRIASEYKRAIDWNAADTALPLSATEKLDLSALEAAIAPALETETYTSSTNYDALNRPVEMTTPHSQAMSPSVIRPSYNEANLLERVDANLRGATADDQKVWTPFVTNIDYDAKGQRQRIGYGNGTSTVYQYDPLTFRLVHLLTRRHGVAFAGDCPEPPKAGWPGCQVQNLRYTYDPAGNITHIRDDAQQTIYFRNKRVEPSGEYTYDAIYRLIEATGREHLGQIGGAPITYSYDDAPRVGIDWSANDGSAMGTYIERYVYDAVGNFLAMQHRGSEPVHAGWTRSYAYDETSLIEDGSGGAVQKNSNRLSSTTVAGGDPITEQYTYDAHGNMTGMPHLGGTHPEPNMRWDYRDQLRQTDLGGGGTAYFVYDASGQRVRKVWEKSPGLIEERIYLGGFEIYRKHNGPIGADTVVLERETLHVMDDKQRIALVETRTVDTAGNDTAPEQLIRYQYSNHLGSASLALDDQAQIISYEEYTPYGSTSYQAVRSERETPNRYRYTGKERDEESGLYYHGARYYAAWLARWTSADPAGVDASIDLYEYAHSRPTSMVDSTGRWPEWVDKKLDEAGASARAVASSAHAVVEGAIWNPTVSGSITRTERSLINFARGKTLEKFLGNIRRLPGALGPTAKDADRALRTTVQQIKTTYARDVAKVVRGATRDATRFIASNTAHAGKEAQAVVNMATGTAKSTVQAARNAVTPVAGSVAAPKVSVGLPGPLGVALKVLAPVGAVLSAASLPESIEKGDVVGTLTDASGFVAGSLETGALALSYFGGSGATGGTALIGTGGAAGAGLATAGAVVGSFAAGLGLGRVLDWGSGKVMGATGAADAIDRARGITRAEGQTGDYSISGTGALVATKVDELTTSGLREVGLLDESKPAYTQTLGWRLAEVLPSWLQ